ncbi:MAG: molybdate ABC transporter substrate-binding protein [Bryobacteraceae bacterium]
MTLSMIILMAGNYMQAKELFIAAAADLESLQTDVTAAFQKQTGAGLKFTIGASGILEKQIENGAPYDVFLSANEQYVKDLAASGAIDPATVRTYAYGRLGLWSRDGKIRDIHQLLGKDVRNVAIANPEHAPYGAAAREFLTRQGLWKQLQPKIVYGENVRETLQYAESGNVDATITSWSLLVNKRDAVLLPADHAPIAQAAGVVATSKQKTLARQFLDFLGSTEGRKILERHGLAASRP